MIVGLLFLIFLGFVLGVIAVGWLGSGLDDTTDEDAEAQRMLEAMEVAAQLRAAGLDVRRQMTAMRGESVIKGELVEGDELEPL